MRLLATAPLLLTLTLAACGGGSSGGNAGPAPVPAGFTRYRGPNFTLAYPASWGSAKESRARSDGKLFYEAAGPGSDPGTLPRWGVGSGPTTSDIGSAAQANEGISHVQNFRWHTVSIRSVSVPGAKAARQIEGTYQFPTSGRAPVPMRKIDLLVQTASGRQYDVVVLGQEPAWQQGGLRKIVESFRPA